MSANLGASSQSGPHPSRWIFVTGSLALVSLIGQRGFGFPANFNEWFNTINLTLAVAVIVQFAAPLVQAKDRRSVIREFRLEYLLLAVFCFLLPLLWLPIPAMEKVLEFFRLSGRAELFWDALQLFLLGIVAVQVLRVLQIIVARGVRPELVLAGSFAGLIVIGTILLLLPRAGAKVEAPISFVDAVFTATSAACVTGLVVRDTGTDFSTFGQMIILALFQLGGLGIITFVAFISVVSTRSLPVPQMVAFRNIISSPSMSDLKRRIAGIVLITFLIEVAGVMSLFILLPGEMHALDRLKWSAFHAVSAFCNAGFALQATSLEYLQTHVPINTVIMGLIFLGGLGFLVILDSIKMFHGGLRNFLKRYSRSRRLRPSFRLYRWTVQSRLSLRVTFWLIVVGVAGFWFLERGHMLRHTSIGEGFLISAFQSITARTAGFNTVPIGSLEQSTLILIMMLMIVGACPVSAGGGIKTVTFGILLLAVRSMISQKDKVEVFGRTIPPQTLFAALSVFVLYTMTAALGVFLMAILDPKVPLLDKTFEMISALSTVGLSTGITADLSMPSKMVLCLAMFIGRVGPISLVLVIFRARRRVDYEFPAEEVVVS